MDPNSDTEALLANSYQEGKNATESKNWTQAVKWLEPVYKTAPDYEEVSTYYFYAAGMLAYESRHWKDALKNLQAVQEKDPGFKDCTDLVEAVRQRQSAADICDQALRSIGEQKHIQPEAQEWNQIASKLDEAKELDPEHEEIPANLREVRKYQAAQAQFIASLNDLRERKYKEAFEKLEGIDDSYREFCPAWASKCEEAAKGKPLQELYERGQAARFKNDWTGAVRYFQELYDIDKGSIYPEAKRLLSEAKELESKSKPQPVPNQESKKPFWKQEVFWVAVGSIAAVIAIIVSRCTLGTPAPTLTAAAVENATAAANATGTAIAIESATVATNATGTAMAMESATAAADATGTAAAVESATAAAFATGTAVAVESATAAAFTTGTAMAMETTTAAANVTVTAAAVESATAAARATETAMAAKNATATALAPTPTPVPTPTPELLPAPVLLRPENGGETIDLRPDLVWKWDGDLDLNYYYEVTIWYNHPDYPNPIDVGWTRATCYTYDHIREGESWELRWRVSVARGFPTKEKDWSPTERCDKVWDPVEPYNYISVPSEIWSHFVKVSPPASPPPPTSKPEPEPTQPSGGGDD